MESDKIEKLITRYFEATTTVAEEETLRAYFSKDSVAAHLEQYAPLFQYFSSAKKETYTKQVSLDKATDKTKKIFNLKWLSAAAVGLLAFGVYFGSSYVAQRNQDKKDAAYAYQQTKKAMNLLAENFNRGTKKVAYLNQFEKTKEKIFNKK